MRDRVSDEQLRTLRRVLSCVTAPFAEQQVRRWLIDWAGRVGGRVREDDWHNVLIDVGAGAGGDGWLLAAHMDHPGFVAVSQRGRDVRGVFHGSLDERYFPGAPMCWHGRGGAQKATVSTVRIARGEPGLRVVTRLVEPGPVEPGTPGMWDLPAMRVRGHRLRSRACDDLAGVALAVCAIERFIADGGAGRVGLLATRAEEAGLLGAMGACRSGLIDPWWTVCSIETSSAPAAGLHLGDGVVVRVGDRQSVFDAGACETLAAVCRRLDDEQPAFRWRRALMAGGVCEATVYQKFGLRCGAVALPLANYHNGGADGVVSTEAIDLRDFASGVELLAELAATPPRMGVEGLGGRFDRLWRDRRGLLEGFDPDA